MMTEKSTANIFIFFFCFTAKANLLTTLLYDLKHEQFCFIEFLNIFFKIWKKIPPFGFVIIIFLCIALIGGFRSLQVRQGVWEGRPKKQTTYNPTTLN